MMAECGADEQQQPLSSSAKMGDVAASNRLPRAHRNIATTVAIRKHCYS